MPTWNQYTEDKLSNLTSHLKRKRVALFVRELGLGPDDVILDLGSEDGSYLATYYSYPQNIVLGDLFEEPMKLGVRRYGLKGYIVIPQDGPIPVHNNAFDAVWCNSVIEHVTVSRGELPVISNQAFRERAEKHQERFAQEIARVSKRYFVQTPCKHFPIESHAWLPLIQYLQHERRWKLSRQLQKAWVKQWKADFHLYDFCRFQSHFPDATSFHIERFLGFPKSFIAIRNPSRQPFDAQHRPA
jgi:hypothetical protein